MSKPRPLYFPEIELTRSRRTTTNQLLYSVNLSRRYGKGVRQQLYIRPGALPTTPNKLRMMVYLDGRPPEPENGSVHWLVRDRVYPGTAVRFQEVVGYDERRSVGTVYLPAQLFETSPPRECYLELQFEESDQPRVTGWSEQGECHSTAVGSASRGSASRARWHDQQQTGFGPRGILDETRISIFREVKEALGAILLFVFVLAMIFVGRSKTSDSDHRTAQAQVTPAQATNPIQGRKVRSQPDTTNQEGARGGSAPSTEAGSKPFRDPEDPKTDRAEPTEERESPSVTNNFNVQVDAEILVDKRKTYFDNRKTTVIVKPPVVAPQRRPSPPEDDTNARRSNALLGDGIHLLRRGDYSGAIGRWEAALSFNETNAACHYFIAIAYRRLGKSVDAERMLARAVRCEANSRIRGWGNLMERIQGNERIWVESARRVAGIR